MKKTTSSGNDEYLLGKDPTPSGTKTLSLGSNELFSREGPKFFDKTYVSNLFLQP
jgi:hypothetical protein